MARSSSDTPERARFVRSRPNAQLALEQMDLGRADHPPHDRAAATAAPLTGMMSRQARTPIRQLTPAGAHPPRSRPLPASEARRGGELNVRGPR